MITAAAGHYLGVTRGNRKEYLTEVLLQLATIQPRRNGNALLCMLVHSFTKSLLSLVCVPFHAETGVTPAR